MIPRARRGRNALEVSARFERIEELDEALPAAYYRRLPLPFEAAFLAGQLRILAP